jgi:hypothetical protein
MKKYAGNSPIRAVLSQETASKIKASFFDGIAVAGYVDHGAFINFTGPNLSLTRKNIKEECFRRSELKKTAHREQKQSYYANLEQDLLWFTRKWYSDSGYYNAKTIRMELENRFIGYSFK